MEIHGSDSFTELEDGRLYTKYGFTNPGEAITWYDKVEVIEPVGIRDKLKITAEKIIHKYK